MTPVLDFHRPMIHGSRGLPQFRLSAFVMFNDVMKAPLPPSFAPWMPLLSELTNVSPTIVCYIFETCFFFDSTACPETGILKS
jgi:hypothetical protein